MIQFRRGKTSSWKNAPTLADGQPGYDKDRHKIKIGDGTHTWDQLPDASGLTLDEILDSEENAKTKAKTKAAFSLLNPAAALLSSLINKDDRPVITYGTEAPNDETVGQLYLQCYDSEPETDYVTSHGTDGIWYFRKWKSGRAECYGTLEVSTAISEQIGSLYYAKVEKVGYPVTFTNIPYENASINSPAAVVWIAGNGPNSKTESAKYALISTDRHTNQATYKINLTVSGFWK